MTKVKQSKKPSKKPSKKSAKTQLEDDSGEEKRATLTGERYGKREPYKSHRK